MRKFFICELIFEVHEYEKNMIRIKNVILNYFFNNDSLFNNQIFLSLFLSHFKYNKNLNFLNLDINFEICFNAMYKKETILIRRI